MRRRRRPAVADLACSQDCLPRTSVVDADCRSHDHANLFIASTSVFPSSGVVNPTLTGAALTLRLAEMMGREL